MARPVAWHRRLHEMHRAVALSDEVAYSPASLGKLFHLQPRALKPLLRILPGHVHGRCTVIDRDDLLAFLGGAIDAEDFAAYLRELRSRPQRLIRRAPRIYGQDDFAPPSPPDPAPEIHMDRGRFEIRFTTREQADYLLKELAARVAQQDFDQVFCPPRRPGYRPARASTAAAGVPAAEPLPDR